VRSILDDSGITAFEIEFLEDWFVDGEAKAASDRRRAMLLEASAALGCHHVKVADFHNAPTTLPQLIDSFGALCEDAARFGVAIGFEFMASAMIHRLEDCLAMVQGAAAPNGGLIVDIAHTTALGISNAEIAHIPARYLVSVELNDNMLPTTPGYDPALRLYCGEGAFDLKAFIAACREAGYGGPWAVEVFNRERLAGRSLAELDETAYRTTKALYD
jgi:sugar phosphate isomerase/epimerase